MRRLPRIAPPIFVTVAIHGTTVQSNALLTCDHTTPCHWIRHQINLQLLRGVELTTKVRKFVTDITLIAAMRGMESVCIYTCAGFAISLGTLLLSVWIRLPNDFLWTYLHLRHL